jgi:uncharacterized membrane protein HdeD (DUF308 family)
MFALDPLLSRRHAAVRGMVAAVLGVIALVWPGVTIGVAVAFFAVYCFADAIQRGSLLRYDQSSAQRTLTILVVLIDAVAGVLAIVYPGITAGVLVIVIGVWALIGGSTEIAAAWQLRSTGSGSGWLTFGGALTFILGVLLIAWPGIGAVSLAIVFGIYLLVRGATLITAAVATPTGGDIGDALA